MACAICETRRPRRACPGVGGDICSPCCGAERETTVDCPLDCVYLREARRHERPAVLNQDQIPHRDVEITESFLGDHSDLIAAVARTVVGVALGTPGVVDADVREALDSLVRTWRTLQSGVYYESRPANPYAARIYAAVQQALPEYRRVEQQNVGLNRTRDADVLGALVFLHRVSVDRDNGRPRGRAFLDFVRGFYPPEPSPAAPRPSSLIVP